MRYVNRWTASCVWVAAMIGAWPLLVPAVISVSSWTLATLSGPVFLVAGSTFWNASRPLPSAGQVRAQAEAAERTQK